MPKASRDALKAKGKTDVWYFDPDDVVLVEDTESAVYDERVHDDEKEVALMLGTSESTIKNLLRLLDAPAVVRNAVDAGKVSVSDGYRLSREEPEAARKKLSKLLEQAPRTPGKKRSQNAKRAREIMGRPESKPMPASGGAPVRSPEPAPGGARATKRLEDEVAEAIAAWIDATWNGDENWDGSPHAIPERIRAGEWRNGRKDGAAA